jgi:hypothetical protein
MTRMKRAGCLLSCWLAAACSCDPATYSGTAVRVRVELDGVTVTQLRFSGAADAQLLFGPETRPAAAGAPLESGGSLLVLLRDEHAGRTVRVDVEGLFEGNVVATGAGDVAVVLGRETEVRVVLHADSCASCAGCCRSGQCVA